MQGERYLALDGLRGIAAIAVLLMHMQIGALHGYLAVDLFFILSGFVIARSYEGALQSGALGLGAYLRVRLDRLYPMLLLGGMVGIGFYLAGLSNFAPTGRGDLALAVVAQFTLIPCLSSALVYYPLNNPPWSIFWELLVNFAHAAGLKRLSNRAMLALAGVCAMWLTVVAQHFGTLQVGGDAPSFLAGLPRVGFGFLAGILLYRSRDKWLGRVPKVSFIWPVAAFIVLVSLPPQLVPFGAWYAAYDTAVVTLAFVPLVMLTVKAEAGPAASALGALSYPLYVLNEPAALAGLNAGLGVAALAAISLGIIALAWVIGHYVDEPLNAMRRRARKRQIALRANTARA